MNMLKTTLSLLALSLAATSFASSTTIEAAGGLSAFSDDFESTDINGFTLGSDWIYFNTVFDGNLTFPLFSYSGDAPNGPQISALVNDQGGPDQETQQLSIFSDYNCCAPSFGHNSPTGTVVTNVFQEQLIGPSNLGETWTFSFDAKAGNIEGASEALAFLRVLDPNNGFSTSGESTFETTLIGNDWARYSISLTIGDWDGQFLQFGFATRAGNFEGSGIFYDNIEFGPAPVPVPAAFWLLASGLMGLVVRRSSTS